MGASKATSSSTYDSFVVAIFPLQVSKERPVCPRFSDRQAVVKRAFQDLRSVPLDQRDTVLNSARYQSQFSPDERGILGNLLRAEPYEPPR